MSESELLDLVVCENWYVMHTSFLSINGYLNWMNMHLLIYIYIYIIMKKI